jgi:hypothetical protein
MNNPLANEPSAGKPAATTITIEEIREESRRRNSEEAAQGYAWGVVIPKLLAENDRLTFLADLIRHCPSASFHHNDDDAIEEAGGPPVGFTIRVDESCMPEVKATAPTFREAIDKFKCAMERASATAAHGNG